MLEILLIPAFIIAVILQVSDGVLTYIGLRLPHVDESNVFMVRVMQALGMELWLVGKIGIGIAVCALLALAPALLPYFAVHPTLVTAPLWVMNAVMAYVVINNFTIVARAWDRRHE